MAKANLGAALRAAEDGKADALRRALAGGVDPDALHRGQSLLVVAATAGPDVVGVLLDAGATIDRPGGDGETPLLAAVANGQVAVVELLLRRGADPNLAKGLDTPLRRAGLRRSDESLEIARLLVDAGADVNRVGHSLRGEPTMTPLTSAAGAANPEMVRFLLSRGARVNEHVKFGTALTAAAVRGDAESVRVLLDAGADPSLRVSNDPLMRDLAGKSALELATAKRTRAVVELLERAAAGGGGPPATAAAASPADVTAAFGDLRRRLGGTRAKSLRPPAPAKALAALERTIGRALPPDLRAWFGEHDGQADVRGAAFIAGDDVDDAGDNFRLLGAAEAAREWQTWVDATAGGPAKNPSRPAAGEVRAVAFDPAWIPLTTNGAGDGHMLDLHPGDRGTPGQVILVVHDRPSRTRVAGGLGEWVRSLATAKDESPVANRERVKATPRRRTTKKK